MSFNHCASVISRILRLGRAVVRFGFNPQQHHLTGSLSKQQLWPRLSLLLNCYALPHQCAAQLVPPYIGRTTEAHRKYHINNAIKHGCLFTLCFKDRLVSQSPCVLSIKTGLTGKTS